MRSLLAFLLGAALSAPLGPACGETPAHAGPNVLLIIADDLNCHLGCYGTKVRTPHLDAFASTAVRFERAYVQYPLCNPSRSSFLTGLKPESLRVFNNSQSFRQTRPDVVTLPQMFRQNGFFAAAFGKVFHRGALEGKAMEDPQSWDLERSGKASPRASKGERRDLLPEFPFFWIAADGGDEEQIDGQIAREAIEFLEKRGGEPFFLTVGFHRPHIPLQCPRKYFDLYPLETLEVPPATPDSAPSCAFPEGGSKEAFASWTDQDRREFLRGYFACVSFVDEQVGQVLAALERLHLDENTIVVFLGDHGYHLGEHGWWTKVTLFEESLRAPLLIRAPGAKGNGHACRALVEFVDLYPTIADLCGLSPPAGLAGTSLRALLEDPSQPGKEAAGSMLRRGKRVIGRSIRTERWRYTEWNEGALGVELYDFADESVRGIDRSRDTEFADTRAELAAVLRRSSSGDR